MRAGLIARLTLPEALTALTEAAAWLDAHHCTPVIEAESAAQAGLGDRWPVTSRDTIARDVDVVIAFGGDGTLLNAASAVAHANEDTPLVGINLGHLGFLTEVGRGDLHSALEALVSGRTTTETRLLLAGRVIGTDGPSTEHLALNDIVLTRGALSRMIEIDVRIDDQFVCQLKADGVIVATATGSTAYNLSAGGPIVHPSVDALVLTPIAPHTLTQRPLVLPASARIALAPAVATDADVVVTFDGQTGVPVNPGETIAIRRAPRVLRFLRTSRRTHFDMLREKLKWGNS
jgi:NAD+ kinase